MLLQEKVFSREQWREGEVGWSISRVLQGLLRKRKGGREEGDEDRRKYCRVNGKADSNSGQRNPLGDSESE